MASLKLLIAVDKAMLVSICRSIAISKFDLAFMLDRWREVELAPTRRLTLLLLVAGGDVTDLSAVVTSSVRDKSIKISLYAVELFSSITCK